jgi:putative ABC transport system substrate-binding protein
VRRRDFITLVGGAAVAWPLAALAQEPGRTYRLGIVSAATRNIPAYVAMTEELRRLGFIEGKNLTIDFRSYGPRTDLIPEFVAELVKAHVDVILVNGDAAIRAAQEATTTIPILAGSEDMVGAGLVNSLAHPGGNTTGMSILATELDGKRQDILIEAVPGLRRMAVLTDVNDAITARLDALLEAARAHGIEFSIHRVAKGGEIAAAIDSAQASGATALNIVASPLFYAHRHLIMDRAAAARLPTMYEWPETAEEGGFAAYGPRRSQLYSEIMAQQIVKIFRGTKVVDIPVEQATKFELVINLKTTKATGVTVPETLLVRADKVIE